MSSAAAPEPSASSTASSASVTVSAGVSAAASGASAGASAAASGASAGASASTSAGVSTSTATMSSSTGAATDSSAAASAAAGSAAGASALGAGFSAFGFRTGFFFSSATNSSGSALVRMVLLAPFSPLKVPQSPLSFSSAVTCSVGCAPTPSQYWARAESISMNEGSSVGWYLPISSMTRPSRLVRESATTMRYYGARILPRRLRRILTATFLLSSGTPEERPCTCVKFELRPCAWGTRGRKL
jgi:hypothetical protein